MLLTIHNLPISTRYSDVKTLIQSRCGLSEILLDNLVNEGQYKKVTLGVAEEEDAAIVVRQINGLYIDGAHLYVEKVRQKKQTEQPYRTGNFDKSDSQTNRVDQPGAQNAPNYPGSMNVPYSNMPYNQPLVNQEMVQMMVAQHMMGMGMGMYYVPQQMSSAKNDFPDSGGQVNHFQYNQRDPNTGFMSNEYEYYQQAQNKKPCKDDEYANYDDKPQSYGRPIDEKDQNYNHDLYIKRHHKFNRSDDADHNPNQLDERYQGFNRNDYDQNQSYDHSPENQHSSRKTRWSREEIEDYQEARSGRSRSRSPYIIESRKTSSFQNRYERHEGDYYRRNSDRPLDSPPERYRDHNENTSRDHNQRPYRAYNEPKSNKYRDNIQSDNLSVRENGNQSYGHYPENRRSSQTRWSREKVEDYEETGPSKRRSRSPYIIESRKISPFENRYERHEDDYHQPSSDRPMDPPPQRYGDRNENSSRGYNQRADRAYQEPKDNRYRDNFKSDNQSIDNKSTTGREYYEPRQQTSSTYRSTGSLVPNKPLPRAGSVSPKGVSPLMSDMTPREIPSQLGNVRPRGNASSNDHVAPNTKPSLMGITPTAESENVPKKQRIEVRIRRDTSFRHEAAAKIGKEAFAKFHHDSITYDDRQKLFKSIKRAIYTRIELLLGTTIGLAKDEIISRYRKQFPPEDDLAYIKTIHSHWEAEMALEKAEAQNKKPRKDDDINDKPQSDNRLNNEKNERYNRDQYSKLHQELNRPDDAEPKHNRNQINKQNQSYDHNPENQHSSRQRRWSREEVEDYQEGGPSFDNRYERQEDDYHQPNSERPIDLPPQRYGDHNENNSQGYNQRTDRAYQEPKDIRYRDKIKSDNQSINNVTANTKPQFLYITPTAGSGKKPKRRRLKAIIKRDTTWRQEAAAKIGREALAKFHYDDINYDDRKKIVKAIKKAINTRIELLLGTKMGFERQEIISIYRMQFPPEDDLAFIKAIHSQWKAELALERAAINAGTPGKSQGIDRTGIECKWQASLEGKIIFFKRLYKGLGLHRNHITSSSFHSSPFRWIPDLNILSCSQGLR